MIWRVVATELVEEVLQRRLIAAAVVLAVVHLLLAPAAGAASLGYQARGVLAVGLWLSTLAGLGGAVFIGLQAVSGALDDGTAELALVRPISRGDWVAGRALGVAVACVLWASLVLAAWLPVGIGYGWLQPGLVAVWGALCLQLCLVGAWALFLGSLARPAIAAMAVGALVFAGVFADEVLLYASEAGAAARVTSQLLYAVLPDLDLLDLHAALVHESAVDIAGLGWSALYTACTAGILVSLTSRVLERRDLRTAA
ncbi:MAG: ABC transporter permease [Deltaproteobacteria bacterium]|nr:MAG: ABC transporter permease [Deltaproteobacteria bacterium]